MNDSQDFIEISEELSGKSLLISGTSMKGEPSKCAFQETCLAMNNVFGLISETEHYILPCAQEICPFLQ